MSSNKSENNTQAEQEHARNLEASVAESLFLGQIVEENLFPFPKMDEDEAETVRIVLESVDKFLTEKSEKLVEFDVQAYQPDEYLESLKELGLFGLIVPEEYEGLGFSSSAYSRVVEQMGRFDASTSLTIGAHCSIGMKGLLMFGSDEQKANYLPRLASGEMIAAFCLTEPGSGSDAGSIRTNAARNDDGSWTLNGEKIWITNGAFADFFTVFARTNSEKGKLSTFIVERGWDGVSTGPKEGKMGIRASATTTVTFDNVRVPAENLLGEEGKGFKIAMKILNTGRTGLSGGCIGGMKQCIRLAALQAAERKQFGRSIAEFGIIKEKIAQMTVDTFAAESAVAMVSSYIDQGVKNHSVEAAISKVFATETLWDVANEALQIAGGNGYMAEFPYEKIVRDSRINMIFEGTNEILRLYIALTGLKDAGRYLKDVSKSVEKIFNDPIKGFGVLSEYAAKKFSQLTSLGRDRIESVRNELRDDALVYEKYAQELARASEMLLRRHKKDIIEKQFALKRISDVVTDLFVGLCVVSRVNTMMETTSKEGSVHLLNMSRIFTQQAKRRMNQNLRRIYKNEDEEMKALSSFIVENEGYKWDIF